MLQSHWRGDDEVVREYLSAPGRTTEAISKLSSEEDDQFWSGYQLVLLFVVHFLTEMNISEMESFLKSVCFVRSRSELELNLLPAVIETIRYFSIEKGVESQVKFIVDFLEKRISGGPPLKSEDAR